LLSDQRDVVDLGTELGDAYDQPVRFGVLGRFSDFFGGQPELVILDWRQSPLTVGYVQKGRSTIYSVNWMICIRMSKRLLALLTVLTSDFTRVAGTND